MSQVNEAGEQAAELQVYAELAVACCQLAKLTIERDSLREQNRALRRAFEDDAAERAINAGLGASEWKAFLSEKAYAALKMGEEE